MATPKRRSARLSGRGTPQRSVKSKTLNGPALLGALIERDETPDNIAQLSIDNVLSTPATNASIQSRFARLSNVKTPTSEPKPAREQMHPYMVHQTTAKAPDSGVKLGFCDPPTARGRKLIAVMQNTPSKAPGTSSDAKGDTKSAYEFKFRSASHLSNEAQQLMDNLRDEAARIKDQMRTEKIAQEEKDAEADNQFQGFGAAGRKIAKPKSKAGRFSDVHMAAFKKMDSIANHASAFRANNGPSFAQPTAQSLKRSPSRAGLDEPARPQTAGKGTPVRRPPPSGLLNRRATSVSPLKSLPKLPQEAHISIPAKRQRQSKFGDVSTARPQTFKQEEKPKPSSLPRPASSSGVLHSLLSPTKSSLARLDSTKVPATSTDKHSMLPRSPSSKSVQPSTGTPFKPTSIQQSHTVQASSCRIMQASTSKIPQSETALLDRPLPPLPTVQFQSSSKSTMLSPQRQGSTKALASQTKTQSIASRLPTFAGLKSILRPSRPQGLQAQASPSRASTPKRPNTANATDSSKKVDFTPSVKSRYAVKLAAESPNPAKIHQDTPRPPSVQFDPAAYTTSDETVEEGEWDDAKEDADAEGEIAYPVLPPSSPAQKKSPSVQTVQAFMQKAKEVSRRESLDFKSIPANCLRSADDNPFSMTAFNTTVNKTNPTLNANKVMKSPGGAPKLSPSTIRRVRPSDAHKIVKPSEEANRYLSHGLPAKKRRHDSEKDDISDDAKENQHPSESPAKVPGGWEDSVLEEDDGDKRGGKRIRVEKSEEYPVSSPQKKANSAREVAGKAAKDRKKKGILSMSRLNMLARPREY